MRKEMKTNYIGQEFWLRPERGAFMRKATYMIAYHIGTWLGFHPPLRNTISSGANYASDGPCCLGKPLEER
jgi:hypothetical protein